MRQKTWPDRSDRSRFTALRLKNTWEKKEIESDRRALGKQIEEPSCRIHLVRSCLQSLPGPLHRHDFTSIPCDVMVKIGASFTLPSLRSASLVCRAWRDALRPLREAMLLLRWGKKFKHGQDGIRQNLDKALNSFLKAAARGSALAMVDAGLMYWEMGKKEEGTALFRKAADLGDPSGQCNLGIAFLQAEPVNPVEAIKWLSMASESGHVRAQYQLALCFHQGCGVGHNMAEAARLYLWAAEGGYARAMYNVSMCYSMGKGLSQNHKRARKWMKLAADHGHSRAQFEHGLGLFSEGDMMKAMVYLELASRAGEMGATHVKDVILMQLSSAARDHAIHLVDAWRPRPRQAPPPPL